MSLNTETTDIQHNKVYNQKLLDDSLNRNDIDQFRKEFLTLHQYEQSEYFENTTNQNRQRIFEFLSPQEVSRFFNQLDIEGKEYEILFDSMHAHYASEVLENMSTDNAVDILNELSNSKVASLLALMDNRVTDKIKKLLHYEEDTAGGIMTTEYISLDIGTSVKEALMLVKNQAPDAETIYVIYVVDTAGQLVGVLSLKDLIVANIEAHVEEVMIQRVVSVNVEEDQERVAQKMKDYDFIAMPVIDYQHHLVGIITIDDILDVVNEEADEDYSRLAGVSDTKSTDQSVFKKALKRLPWLIILTFLGMITATILGGFEDTLSQVALLAAFIPIISGMSGNSGTQSLAVSVRNISNGDIKEKSKLKIALKEAGSGLITGFVCAVILFLIIVIIYRQPFLALIVGASLTIAMTVGTLVGSMIPILMNKIHIDPAVASGPFITTINDIVSMLIYFGLATTFMSYLT
ncbi:magnesium transporter [Staphylococcus hominis]|uniref:Magnesium transporter MgtE n=2 Tax=Staphylococcus TaxID=1279 RepID=A0A974QPA2_STAHO|nr:MULTISPECIES: magnesium transporter [Staphylococcus]EFS19149.1 magnesium transporter [Staphylococcus hominis subsp. hominis C80]EHR88581.1 magnesium transporter [Staphylococcus hominis VCU122]MBV5221079.1 magnesium transporter [Staphylococcus hominis]MCC3710527.1 magnesium transporter [Staphylococcus hominis]MCC3713226.1 magnesium transporter [Staphylococcus hominis]